MSSKFRAQGTRPFALGSLVSLASLLIAGLSAFLALNVNLQRLVSSNDALIPAQEPVELMLNVKL